MSYRPPNFNLICNVYTSGNNSLPPRISPNCNLAWGARVNAPTGLVSGLSNFATYMVIMFPKLTDIRGSLSTTGADLIECPAGSGRLYAIYGVDDIGKGFANEHRAAIVHLSSYPTPLT